MTRAEAWVSVILTVASVVMLFLMVNAQETNEILRAGLAALFAQGMAGQISRREEDR